MATTTSRQETGAPGGRPARRRDLLSADHRRRHAKRRHRVRGYPRVLLLQGDTLAALRYFDSDQKIIRWADYWDGRSSLQPNTIPGTYPDFRDSEQNADPAVVQATQALQAAFAADDAAAAVVLMSADVVHKDIYVA